MCDRDLAIARFVSEVKVILPVIEIMRVRIQSRDLGFSPLRVSLHELRELALRRRISIHPECRHGNRVSLERLRLPGPGEKRDTRPRRDEDRLARPYCGGEKAEDDEDSSLIQGPLLFSLDETLLLQERLPGPSFPNCCR